MKFRYKSYNIFYVFLLFVFVLGGCAITIKPALNQNIKSLDISAESVALLTVKVSNKYKPKWQPDVKFVDVCENDTDSNKKYKFEVDGKYNEIKNESNEYLISFQLPPGKYKLTYLIAPSKKFPIQGIFTIPIYSLFEIEHNQIIYLGHIEAYVKERTNDDDLRAGPVIPLIDQAVTGAFGGTFVVEINDLYQHDIKLFKNQYPYLSAHEIVNRTLPPWKQPNKEDL